MAYLQLIANALAEGALIAIAALGLAVVLYPMRVFHVALGGVFVGAAYVLGLATTRLGWPLGVGALAAVLSSLGLGVAIEYWVYRPLLRKRASALPVAISSFAAYFVIVSALAVAVGNQQMVILRESALLSLGRIVVSGTQLAMILCGVATFALLSLALRSRMGRAVRAMEDNPELLRACGWSTGRVRLACITASSFLGGMAGILTALDKGIEPGMGMPALLNGLVVVVAAGPGAYRGIFAVATGLAVLQAGIGYTISPRWSVAVSFAVLTAFLILRPSGLFSVSRRVEELA